MAAQLAQSLALLIDFTGLTSCPVVQIEHQVAKKFAVASSFFGGSHESLSGRLSDGITRQQMLKKKICLI